MEAAISATYLARHLSEILDQVQERGDLFVFHRNGETIARLEPVSKKPGITARELLAQIGDLKMPGDGFADDLEAIQAEQGLAEMPEWPD